MIACHLEAELPGQALGVLVPTIEYIARLHVGKLAPLERPNDPFRQ